MINAKSLEIKELKKEILDLPNLEENFKKFQGSWIHPLGQNNLHLPFLKGLDAQTKAELYGRLDELQSHCKVISESQVIHDRLHHHAHHLVELKLTTFNGDKNKAKMLTNDLTRDETGIKRTITHIRDLHNSLLHLSQQYEEVNLLLDKKLSLEQTVYYMSLPHRKYLNALVKTANHHQKIVRDLSHHFVSIAEELQTRKNMSH